MCRWLADELCARTATSVTNAANVAELLFSDYLRDVPSQQLIECLLLLVVLKNSLRNHRKSLRSVVKHVRVGINQSSRIQIPSEIGIDVRCLEMDTLRRERERVLIAKLRFSTEDQWWNDEEGRKENYGERYRNAKKHFAAQRRPEVNARDPDDNNYANVQPKAKAVGIMSTQSSNVVAL
jgi:hypothetical protein